MAIEPTLRPRDGAKPYGAAVAGPAVRSIVERTLGEYLCVPPADAAAPRVPHAPEAAAAGADVGFEHRLEPVAEREVGKANDAGPESGWQAKNPDREFVSRLDHEHAAARQRIHNAYRPNA